MNARRVIVALSAFFGASLPSITVEKLKNPRTLIVLGVAPVRIDVVTKIDGVDDFREAFNRRCDGTFGTTTAHYLRFEDLIQAKLASARAQDLADVEALRMLRRNGRSPRSKRTPK